jgi:SAM-dependent methyltransferase
MGTGARALTSLRLRARDAAERLGGARDPLLPPRRLRGRVGDGDFVAIGDAIVDRLRADAGLKPDSVVLDIGCGCGRVARPLAAALGARGRYTGFDVDRQAIAWCARAYSPDDRFRFIHADVTNAHYRPDGGAPATGYRFPADDHSVDVVVAASVLTHVLDDVAEHYLAEAARVLSPGGHLLATVFALDGPPPQGAAFSFAHRLGAAAVELPGDPEQAVAYDAGWLAGRLEAKGLAGSVQTTGTWRQGDAGTADFQDVLTATREVAP